MVVQFTNNASTLLLEPVSVDAVSLTLVRGTGDKFPVVDSILDPGKTFNIAVCGTEGRFEIMSCVHRDADVLSVLRAQEGTVAMPFEKGALVENRLTAGYINGISSELVNLHTSIANLGTSTTIDIDALRTETDTKIDAAKTELNTSITNASAMSTAGINESKAAAAAAHGAADAAMAQAIVATNKADAAQGSANAADTKAQNAHNRIDALNTTVADVSSMPPGTVFHHAAAYPPAGSIAADGSYVSMTSYPRLYAAIGTMYGSSESTFKVPDLRGNFIRSLGGSAGGQGSVQSASTKQDAISLGVTYVDLGGGGHDDYVLSHVPGYSGWWTTLGGNSNETRPINMSMLACIKY